MDITFNTKDDLYQRLYPALHAKRMELERLGFSYIKEQNIWDYLSFNIWKNSKNLMLSDMVEDILHLDNKKIDSFVKNGLASNS